MIGLSKSLGRACCAIDCLISLIKLFIEFVHASFEVAAEENQLIVSPGFSWMRL